MAEIASFLLAHSASAAFAVLLLAMIGGFLGMALQSKHHKKETDTVLGHIHACVHRIDKASKDADEEIKRLLRSHEQDAEGWRKEFRDTIEGINTRLAAGKVHIETHGKKIDRLEERK